MHDYLKKVVVYLITLEAKQVLKKYRPRIVAVTGTVGKTSTKDAIFAVLGSFFYARKSLKSFNSEIGVPLTILGCPNGWDNPLAWLKNLLEGLALVILPSHYPKWLILEVGADKPGDIERICRWLKPDVAVFTKMSQVPVHVEFFDSPEAVLQEKLELIKSLGPYGVIVYNYDDKDVRESISSFGQDKFSYGFNKKAQISASNYHLLYEKRNKVKEPIGITFKVNFQGGSIPVSIRGAVGRQHVYAVLAGLSVGFSQGVNFSKAAEGLSEWQPPAGRMRILPGVKKSIIIDDSYNSSPIALTEALTTLKEIKTVGRKIALLGDMLELGKYSIEEHRKAGNVVSQFLDFLITVGIRAKYLAEAAREAGMAPGKIFESDDARLAGKHAELLIKENDIVL
ncbi:MAG: hypothetical protein G01um1014107_359, partial [Parcubacteria group bacterium Gr01-1014_107]